MLFVKTSDLSVRKLSLRFHSQNHALKLSLVRKSLDVFNYFHKKTQYKIDFIRKIRLRPKPKLFFYFLFCFFTYKREACEKEFIENNLKLKENLRIQLKVEYAVKGRVKRHFCPLSLVISARQTLAQKELFLQNFSEVFPYMT